MRNTWSIQDGLPQISVQAITQDRKGYMWVATQAGVARFDGIRFTTFTPENEPALPGIWMRTPLTGRDGRVWIGLRHCDRWFDTTGLQNISLPETARDLAFESTALSFQDPRSVGIRYRLLGYDRHWRELALPSLHTVNYTNLPAGRYVLEVMASNNAGVWNRKPVVLALSIKPYFQESAVFRLLAITLLDTIIYAGYRQQRRFELYAQTIDPQLGVRIDREVFGIAPGWLEEHPQAADEVATCSINLSAKALADEDFIGFVAERLRNSSFPFINDMRALGCRFALDDFGTGFCSFNYLRALDVDYFKIDGSVVRDLQSSALSMAVIRSITDIAHVLDKQTIAEHTENQGILASLRALGVDFA